MKQKTGHTRAKTPVVVVAAAAAALPAVQRRPDPLELADPTTLVPILSSRTRMSSADAMITRVHQTSSATVSCFLGP